MYTLNCNGKLVSLSTPKVMGIINVTPDSFFDGGKTLTHLAVLKQAERMLTEGASFLDVGGYSSRPGADQVLEEEEKNRVVPAIEAIMSRFPEAIISIDTFRSSVARAAVESGAAMVNDISAGILDPLMLSTVASLQKPYIMMHMRGTPQDMQSHAHYNHMMKEVLMYFSQQLSLAKAAGINDLIVDPGFGFAKTQTHNFQLLHDLEIFKQLEVPILVGISRKSMIYKSLGISAQEGLNGTTALHSIALWKGASILRVHDVKEAVECVKLFENLNSAS